MMDSSKYVRVIYDVLSNNFDVRPWIHGNEKTRVVYFDKLNKPDWGFVLTGICKQSELDDFLKDIRRDSARWLKESLKIHEEAALEIKRRLMQIGAMWTD